MFSLQARNFWTCNLLSIVNWIDGPRHGLIERLWNNLRNNNSWMRRHLFNLRWKAWQLNASSDMNSVTGRLNHHHNDVTTEKNVPVVKRNLLLSRETSMPHLNVRIMENIMGRVRRRSSILEVQRRNSINIASILHNMPTQNALIPTESCLRVQTIRVRQWYFGLFVPTDFHIWELIRIDSPVSPLRNH